MNVIRSAVGLFTGLLLLTPGTASADKHEFSIVVLPDTQLYTETYPAVIEAQMRWITRNRDDENIIYVAHLGDLKDDSHCNNKLIAAATGGSRSEWDIIDRAFNLLETETSTAQPDGIPFGTVAGNHDFEPVADNCPWDWVNQRTLTTYDDLFGPNRFSDNSDKRDYYGGSRIEDDPATTDVDEGSNEDNYTLFESNGVRFIAINLGYRQFETLGSALPEHRWASRMLREHSDRIGIVTSHFIMRCNNSDDAPTVLFNGELWNGCRSSTEQQNTFSPWGKQLYMATKDNPNLFMMLGAHNRGEAYRRENRLGMQPVHAMLSNYQNITYPTGNLTDPATFSSLPPTKIGEGYGNSGFMRIMRFDIDSGTVDIETFAPPVPETDAVAGTISVADCQDFDFVYMPGDVCSTPAISARLELKSVYTPANPGAEDTLHTATASNMTGIDFTGYTGDEVSIVVLPSTRSYLENNPEIFEAQVDWVVTNRVSENIIYVSHLGDLKDDRFCDDKIIVSGTGAGRFEWQIVDDTLARLEAAGIPYGVLPGNHDFDQVAGVCPNYETQRPLSLYNTVLGPARFAGQPYYGDPGAGLAGNRVAGSNEDNFTLFGFGGIDFIAINLAYRFAPSPFGGNPEASWADSLLKQYPDRLGIVTSHDFMEQNAEVGSGGPFNLFGPYGAFIFDELSDNPNLFMMLGANDRGEAWRVADRSANGLQPVHVLLQDYASVNYPFDPGNVDFGNLNGALSNIGDSGFARIMRFDKRTCQVDIQTFAPAVPFLNRTDDLISDYFPTGGTGMDKDTASNFSLSFAGYGAVPGCP